MKPRILPRVVSFVAVNDGKLLREARILNPIAPPEKRAAVLEAAVLVQRLLEGSSFCGSAEFLEWASGRSESVVEMKKKLADDPVRHREYRARLDAGLCALPADQSVRALIDRRFEKDFDRLMELAVALESE